MNEHGNAELTEKFGFQWIILPACINMDNYSSVGQCIHDAITKTNNKVVVDFSRTVDLYSSGLGLIIRIRKQVCELGGVIYLVNVSKKIRSIFESVRLDKIFTMYATDIEFEISQEQFTDVISGDKFGYVFITRIENGLCRINLSGHMTLAQDLSQIHNFKPMDRIVWYVFDLTGLDLVDSAGVNTLIKLTMSIANHKGKCIAYGLNENVNGLVKLLGMDEYIIIVQDERLAIEIVERNLNGNVQHSAKRHHSEKN
jgi:anti-anti-sigma factor